MFVREVILQPRSLDDAVSRFTSNWQEKGYTVKIDEAFYQLNLFEPFDDVVIKAWVKR